MHSVAGPLPVHYSCRDDVHAKRLASWVDEYGTGSGSDRLQPAIRKSFNAGVS